MIENRPVPAESDAGRHMLRGLAWVGSLRWLGQVISWLSTLAVARFLLPEDYGLVGMAMVFINLAQVLSDFGIGSTVIAMQRLTTSEIEELHTASLLLGAAGALLTAACAFPIASYYAQPDVLLVVIVLGLVLLVNGAAAVPGARLSKDLNYAGMAASELLRSVIGGVTALALAWAGAGVWALVGGQLAGGVSGMAYVYRLAPTPIRRPHSGPFFEALRYSKESMLASAAWMFYLGAPYLIGGRMLGASIMGEYSFSQSLASMPSDKLVNVVTQVARPVLAKNQADAEALRRLVGWVLEGVAFLTWPILAGMALVADAALPTVFGEKWAGAVTPLQFLAVFHMSWAVLAPFSHVLLVVGEARRTRQIATMGALVLPVCFWVGIKIGGGPGLAAAWLVGIPLFGVPYLIVLRRAVGFGVGEFVRAVRAPALATAAMSLVVMATDLIEYESQLARLSALVASGGLSFVLTAIVLRGRMLSSLLWRLRGAE